MKTLRLFLGAAALTCAAFSSACLWDRDTLNDQHKKFPGLMEAATGWFDKNPDLYYSLRAKRLTKLANSQELSMDEYDDLAVSLDHLGKSTDAIAWENKKKAKLDAMGDAAPKDQIYRFHSNVATFEIHRWLAKGDRTHYDDVDDSISHLQTAIQVNPDAHFGREAVQLNLEKLIKFDLTNSPKPGGFDAVYYNQIKDITDNLNKEQAKPGQTEDQAHQKALEGVTGIIVLGYGYKLTDLYLLANTQLFDNGKMKFLDELRMNELEGEGVGHIWSPSMRAHFPIFGTPALPDDKVRLMALYKGLRKDATAFDKYRLTYMNTRLKKGLHPDTDKNFWASYKPRAELKFSIDEPNAYPYHGPA